MGGRSAAATLHLKSQKPTTMNDTQPLKAADYVSYGLAAALILIVLLNGLVGALFAGLLVHALVNATSPYIGEKIGNGYAKIVAVTAIGSLVITALTLAVWGIITFFQSDAGSAEALLQRMADILDASREQCPAWICTHVPDNAEELREMITNWMRTHAKEARTMSEDAGHTLIRVLLGMIIGAMVSLHVRKPMSSARPLSAAMQKRIRTLSLAFRKIVFAQVRISAVNTIFTAIYILVVLPMLGVHLSLAKSLVVITFIAGLMPIIGNLISNTILVIVALPHGLGIAASSLVFLVVLHKLEYFLNAKIIGSEIKAHAWELLIAMLVMESIFGITGVVAAPVLYAYIKQELIQKQLI